MKGFRMIETIIDLCIDTIVDSAKLIPFLFLTYLAMEYVEHKAADSMKRMILRAGKAALHWVPFLESSPNVGSLLRQQACTQEESLPSVLCWRSISLLPTRCCLS